MPLKTIEYPGCRLEKSDDSSTPTSGRPSPAARFAVASGAPRPRASGYETSTIVQPSRVDGQLTWPFRPLLVPDGVVDVLVVPPADGSGADGSAAGGGGAGVATLRARRLVEATIVVPPLAEPSSVVSAIATAAPAAATSSVGRPTQ